MTGSVDTEGVATAPSGSRRPAWGPGGWSLFLGMFVVVLDGSALNLALPDMADALGASASQTEWVVNAYLLPMATLLLTAGSLGRRIGPRRLYVAAMIGFAVFSVACACAPTIPILILARGGLGMCGAAILPHVLALLVHTFQDSRDLARAMNAVSVSGALALVAGPFVGGLATTMWGWRAIFWLGVPATVLAAGLALRGLPPGTTSREGGFDVLGQLTGTASLLLVVGGLVETGDHGLDTAWVVLPILAGLLLGLVFVVVERHAGAPLVPGSLFRSRTFRAAVLAGYAFQFNAFGLQFMFALWLQQQWHLDAVEAAVMLLPFSITSILTTAIVNPILLRRGTEFMLTRGLLLAIAGTISLVFVEGPGTWWVLAAGNVLVGAGSSIYSPTLNRLAASSTGTDHSGSASSVYFTFRQVGMATAVAVLGGLVSSSHPHLGGRLGIVISLGLLTMALVSLRPSPAPLLLDPTDASREET